MAAYMSILKPGDSILGLNLAHGGHLTHGHPLNFSGKMYKIIPYGVRKDTETIDYDELEQIAEKEHPTLIVGGGAPTPASSTLPACERSPTRLAPDIWLTWRTLPDWWQAERILRRCRIAIS